MPNSAGSESNLLPPHPQHETTAHLSNAAWGVAEYAAYPLGLLAIAPLLLHRLGISQFGVWALATAAVNVGSIVASGFGDANIQYVATYRSTGQPGALLRAVRSTMGIHLVLGSALGMALWLLAPFIASHAASGSASLHISCLWSLRIAAFLVLGRTIECVCVSTQRAFERYGAAVRISIAARLATLALAALLACVGRSVVSIMVMSTAVMIWSLWLQLARLRRLLHAHSLAPLFERAAIRPILAFGIFSWLQAVSGVLVSQSDRLITGVSLGATAVAAYALCAQLAQPVYGLAASGLHFLFPHLSGRRLTASPEKVRATIGRALLVNLALVSVGAGILLAFGTGILRAWAGNAVAQTAGPILPLMVWSTALLALGVTANYSMLAFGRVRSVTLVNLAGAALMIASIAWLLPHYGLYGIVLGRLVYGVMALLPYLPLLLLLYPRTSAPLRSISHSVPAAEGGQNISVAASFAAPPAPDSPQACANVLGTRVEALDMPRALGRVKETLESNQKGYISVVGVHGIMEAVRNPRFAAIYAESAITVPDGTPTVWVGRFQGHRNMQRVAGPDLMLEVFGSPELASCTHFLYGGREGVAQELSARLTRRFPGVRIVGTYTPPYRDLSFTEEDQLISTIRRLKPDFVWVGISTPRQEEFMNRYLPVLDTRLMVGVGAAFDFHTGRIRDCATWIKHAGLQWLHRLIQDPRRLWRRYLRNNSSFLWHITLQLTGLRTYPPAQRAFTRSGSPAAVNRVMLHERESDLG